MNNDDGAALLRWKELDTAFGELAKHALHLCLHAEQSGTFRDDRVAELSTSTTVCLIVGNGGWLWWLDRNESSADAAAVATFLELANKSGELKDATKSKLKLIAGKWERVPTGVRNASSAAEWMALLFIEARCFGETFPTRRGDCIRDSVGASRQACDRMIAKPNFGSSKRESELQEIQRRLRSASPTPLMIVNDDTLADLFPKPTPNAMTDRRAVPFTEIANELWRCWESVLYGVEARLFTLSVEQHADWLKRSYWPELVACLKRTWLLLPADVDFVVCSADERTALRDLNQLVHRLWRTATYFGGAQRVGILESDDEARFGRLVATFDIFQSHSKNNSVGAPSGGDTELKRMENDELPDAVVGPVGLADITKRVMSLERGAKKSEKPLTHSKKILNQRIKHCWPMRHKGKEWPDIHEAYEEMLTKNRKLMRDDTTPDALRLQHGRRCETCLEDAYYTYHRIQKLDS